jgi:hypothetical protein
MKTGISYCAAILFYLTIWSPLQAQNNTVDPAVLEDLIEKKVEMDKKGVFKERFTIQLYYGKREEAEKVEKKYKSLNYDWECDLHWESPYLAVRVGSFKNRLQADRALLKIKDYFEGARVMKP